MNLKGYVIGIRQPIIIDNDDSGTIIIFVRINQVGNRLKSATVNGSVPACAKTVTATDCQILSAIHDLKPSLR